MRFVYHQDYMIMGWTAPMAPTWQMTYHSNAKDRVTFKCSNTWMDGDFRDTFNIAFIWSKALGTFTLDPHCNNMSTGGIRISHVMKYQYAWLTIGHSSAFWSDLLWENLCRNSPTCHEIASIDSKFQMPTNLHVALYIYILKIFTISCLKSNFEQMNTLRLQRCSLESHSCDSATSRNCKFYAALRGPWFCYNIWEIGTHLQSQFVIGNSFKANFTLIHMQVLCPHKSVQWTESHKLRSCGSSHGKPSFSNTSRSDLHGTLTGDFTCIQNNSSWRNKYLAVQTIQSNMPKPSERKFYVPFTLQNMKCQPQFLFKCNFWWGPRK